VLFFNAHDDAVTFSLPSDEYAPAWDLMVNTAGEGTDSEPIAAHSEVPVQGKSLVVLRAYLQAEVEPDHSVSASLAQAASGATQPPSATAPGKPVL
jgi:isoamylase